MLAGLGLLLIGALFLLKNLGYIRGDLWSYIVPLIIILLGVSMIVKGSGKGKAK